MTVTTSSGFTCEIVEDAADDLEFLELLMEVKEDEKTQSIYLPKLLKIMIGEEGYKALKEHIRDENGRARISKAGDEFQEIMQQASESKKK